MEFEDIKKLLLQGERVTLEAKLAEKDVPKSIWETYSAFANTVGGTILLGVEEHRKEKDPAKRFEIHGVEDADKIGFAYLFHAPLHMTGKNRNEVVLFVV